MDRKKYLSIWLWLLVILVAVGLRLMFIETPFWYDEACSWATAIQAFPKGILGNLNNVDLQHTPLYFFILHFWMKIFGDSEISIRSLSLIFGVATIPMVYFVANKITTKLNTVLATVLAIVSPLLVFFSVEARMYPIVVFLVLLSLNFLIDFEQKGDKKSLVKLVITNLLIPYTLVGGIMYNLSLMICYGLYLFDKDKNKFNAYAQALVAELVLLVPYFVMACNYAKLRSLFVIKHEGMFLFSHFVDLIRNFFSVSLSDNVYWPSSEPYSMTIALLISVIIPCVYFVYGYVQGFKNSEGFNRFLYVLITAVFVEFVVMSFFQVNVFTVRYVLYLLPPMLLLSIMGLSGKLTTVHLNVFVFLYAIFAIGFDINYSSRISENKKLAFKVVRLQADELKFDSRDVVIMPFGADAPYYFRDKNAPKVLPFDFHKQVRNPENPLYYTENQQRLMKTDKKHQVIYDAVFSNKGFSDSHYEFFIKNVNQVVPSGRYVLIALYSSDAEALVHIEDLRKSITSVQDVKDRCLEIMLKKYLFDIRAYLENEFTLIDVGPRDNYTYILLQKK